MGVVVAVGEEEYRLNLLYDWDKLKAVPLR